MSSRWQRLISLIGVLTLVVGTLAFARPETFAAPAPAAGSGVAARAQDADSSDPTPVAGATAATTTDTNLWSGPGTDFNLLLVVPALSTVTLAGNSQSGFWEVVYRSVQGWIDANDLVTIKQSTAQTQPAAAPAEATSPESPSPSPAESPSPAPAESPSPNPSPSEVPASSPAESPSPSPSPSASPSPSPSLSPSSSPAPSPSTLPSPPASASPSPSVSPSPSPSAKAAVAPATGAAGAPITLTVSGFAPDEPLAQYWGDATQAGAWGAADGSGAGTIDRKVPNVAAGDYTLTVKGVSSGRSATTTFTVTPVHTSLAVSPASGTPGTDISLTADGFLPGEQVAQYWGEAAQAGAWGTADAGGTATINRTVPKVAAGDVTLRVVGQTSGRTASTSFTVIAPTPSPSPSPSASPSPSPSPSASPSPSPSSSPAVTVAPASGAPGTPITLTATGFAPDETVAQYWGNAALAGAWGTAENDGTAVIARYVPNVTAGPVSLRVVGLTSGKTANVAFTVSASSTSPSPSPSPGTSPPPTEPHGTATTTDSLNLRTGPGTDFDILLVMPPNALVTLTGKTQNGFLSVHYQDLDGWASADYLNVAGNPAPPPSSPPPSQGPTTGATGPATVIEALNLRSGPAIGTTILTVMPAGAAVTLTGQMQGSYLAVQYQGTNGWAASAYLDKTAPGGGEHWIDVDRTHGQVRLYVGNKVTATYQGIMSTDKSNDGFYATAIGTYSVYEMNADLTWTDYGGVFIADWVGFDPDRYNGFHSYPMDANGNVLPGATGPSHGCVRLAPADAQAVYGFAYLGMRVVVHW